MCLIATSKLMKENFNRFQSLEAKTDDEEYNQVEPKT